MDFTSLGIGPWYNGRLALAYRQLKHDAGLRGDIRSAEDYSLTPESAADLLKAFIQASTKFKPEFFINDTLAKKVYYRPEATRASFAQTQEEKRSHILRLAGLAPAIHKVEPESVAASSQPSTSGPSAETVQQEIKKLHTLIAKASTEQPVVAALKTAFNAGFLSKENVNIQIGIYKTTLLQEAAGKDFQQVARYLIEELDADTAPILKNMFSTGKTVEYIRELARAQQTAQAEQPEQPTEPAIEAPSQPAPAEQPDEAAPGTSAGQSPNQVEAGRQRAEAEQQRKEAERQRLAQEAETKRLAQEQQRLAAEAQAAAEAAKEAERQQAQAALQEALREAQAAAKAEQQRLTAQAAQADAERRHRQEQLHRALEPLLEEPPAQRVEEAEPSAPVDIPASSQAAAGTQEQSSYLSYYEVINLWKAFKAGTQLTADQAKRLMLTASMPEADRRMSKESGAAWRKATQMIRSLPQESINAVAGLSDADTATWTSIRTTKK